MTQSAPSNTSSAPSTAPLVTIGIPTFNRSKSLARAVESARSQVYPNIEIVISDNASTDTTRDFCTRMCGADTRVRYLRQPSNVGAERNFAAVLEAGRGEFFLWLADDDWIDADYVSLCVVQLIARTDVVLVSGNSQFHDADGNEVIARSFQIEADSGFDRVRSYYLAVDDNAVFYGVMRRQGTHLGTKPTIAADWYFVAALAARGKILMLSGTCLHRSSAGASANLEKLTNYYNLSGRTGRNPYGLIARNAAKRVLWTDHEFRNMPLSARVSLAAAVYSIIYRRFCQRLSRPTLMRDRLIDTVHEGIFAAARRLRGLSGSAEKVETAQLSP